MEEPRFELQPQKAMENTEHSDEEAILYGLNLAKERLNATGKGEEFGELFIALDDKSIDLANHYAREYELTKQDLKQVNVHFVTNDYAENLKKVLKPQNQNKVKAQSLYRSDEDIEKARQFSRDVFEKIYGWKGD